MTSRFGSKQKKLGVGTYGTVKLYKNNAGEKFAIKTAKNITDQLDTYNIIPDDIVVEIATLGRLKHPNVINLIDFFINYDGNQVSYNLVLPAGDYDLGMLIESGKTYDTWSIAHQIALGLNYMLNENVLSGDIKPHNIIVFENGGNHLIKLADFGISQIGFCCQKPHTKTAYTLWYRAPEILLGDQYDEKADAWAFGCILSELYYKRVLLRGK